MNFLKKYIIPLILGACFGILLDVFYFKLVGDEDITMINIIFLFLFVVCSYILHIAIHEAGHLIFGLASGYQFISYRFGSFMWIKQEGKLIVKQHKVAGTAGQCLMLPPKEGKPFILYNMGGGLLNILVSVVSLLLIPFSFHVVLTTFLFAFGFVGICTGMINLVPMVVGGVATDGYNIRCILKEPALVESMYKQLEIAHAMVNGLDLFDKEDAYYEIPEGTSVDNPLNTYVSLLKAERYLYREQIELAQQLYEAIFENKQHIGVYRFVAQVNLLLIECFKERKEEVISKYYNKEMKQRIKANYTDVSLCLVEVAIAKYVEHDEVALAQSVQKLRKAFEKTPFKYEVEVAQKRLNEILSEE